jgi:RNA recognition motif-containing protein
MDIQVGNISLNLLDSDIRKLFSPFGIVNSAEVNRDRFSGRSKGFALVNMPVDNQARQAILSLHQTLIDGKKISVNESPDSPQWHTQPASY